MDNGVALATLSALTTDHYVSALKPLSREREREGENLDTLPRSIPLVQTNSLFYSCFPFFFAPTMVNDGDLSFPGDARATAERN